MIALVSWKPWSATANGAKGPNCAPIRGSSMRNGGKLPKPRQRSFEDHCGCSQRGSLAYKRPSWPRTSTSRTNGNLIS
jgi:hypothetical protein